MSELRTPYTLTLKGGKDFDAPWLVVSAETIDQLHDRVNAVMSNGLFATIGNAAKEMHAQYQLGKSLGAQPVSPPTPEAPPVQPPAAVQPSPAATSNPWNQPPAQPVASAPPVSQPPATFPPQNTGGWPPAPAWAK